MAARQRPGRPFERTRHQHGPDARHKSRCGNHPRPRGAEKLWAGTVVIHPKAKTGAHHHGPVESVIYVVSGRARMRWGDRLEFVAEAGPGDFIYVPPYLPHQEINASDEAPLSCVLVRSGQEPVVVNLDLPMSSQIRKRSNGSTTCIRRAAATRSRRASGCRAARPSTKPLATSAHGLQASDRPACSLQNLRLTAPLTSANAYSVSSGPRPHPAGPGEAPSIPAVKAIRRGQVVRPA